MRKQSLIKGTIILGAAGVFARFLGLFFRWPLIMLIGDEGIGYYQMSYPLYMFFIGLATGVPVAISKMVSERNALHDEGTMILIVRKALLTMLILGGGFSIIFLAFPKILINFFKWDKKALYSLMGIGAAPLFISLMSVFRGFFQGMQNMTHTAVSQIIEQVGRVVFGVGLAILLLPKGIEYAAGGAAFGAAAGGIVGFIYLYIKYIKVRRRFNVKKLTKDDKILTELLHIAVPVSLGAAVGTIMSLLDSIIVPQQLLKAGYTFKQAAVLYGQLTGKAMVLINVPLTISIALCASLVPIIAEAHVLKRRMEVINKVEMAMKVSMVISLPSTFGLLFLAAPILNLLFPGHAEGYDILRYASLSIPFIIITQTTTAILQGSGYYFKPIKNLLIGCLGKIIITILLVPLALINIYGAIIGSITAYVITTVLNLIALSKKLGVSINYYQTTVKPAYAAILMIIGVVFIYQYVYNSTMSNEIACLVSISLGTLIYAGIIFLLGVFNFNYFKSKFIRG
ncbi:putative polysaccharide biosynthesis protein [Clostridium thermarum]|uniref:putative polysaccharide biosynthesis protein n=1 Tax=Clostridium thermarum TaxID=1716543 RepID=UPI001123AD28|nr:polysaccharide biosynthesis protein [Clostridium thermarum]